MRSLHRRIEALARDLEPAEVLEALLILRAGGALSRGPAQDRAQELWDEAGRIGGDDDLRYLRSYLLATRTSIMELLACDDG